jgi:hypothetical protein
MENDMPNDLLTNDREVEIVLVVHENLSAKDKKWMNTQPQAFRKWLRTTFDVGFMSACRIRGEIIRLN